MSKKVLNTKSVLNELRGQSAFFRQEAPLQSSTDEQSSSSIERRQKTPKKRIIAKVKKESPFPAPQISHSPTDLPIEKKSSNVSKHDSYQASYHAIKLDSMIASKLANTQNDIIETIRKTVKQVGKDAQIVRITPDEKHKITTVVYSLYEMYRGEIRKTSENELVRIGLNLLLEDYKANGKASILVKVLTALNA